MTRHRRRPPPKVSKPPPTHNPDPTMMIERLCADLVEMESTAVGASECVTALPVILFPTSKHQRTMKRLFTLVGATAAWAGQVLEEAEDMLGQLSAAARAGKRRAR
jgi:hypothetical protein